MLSAAAAQEVLPDEERWLPNPWVGQPLIFSYANCAFYDMILNFLLAARAVGLTHVFIIATGRRWAGS